MWSGAQALLCARKNRSGKKEGRERGYGVKQKNNF
jgi:hypothetical protein